MTDGKLDRILSVDKQNQILWIPKPEFNVSDIKQLEFVIHQWWAIANLRVKNIEVVGDSAAVTFYQPESRIEFEHPWPAPFIDKKKDKNGNSAFYFVSAVELLNNPGEWYEDLNNGKLYYWPRENENLASAEVIIPIFIGYIGNKIIRKGFELTHFSFISWIIGFVCFKIGTSKKASLNSCTSNISKNTALY